MFNKLELLTMAQSMARHAAGRQSVIAGNIANADTPGFQARDIASFAATYQDTSDSFQPRATRAGHQLGVSRNTMPLAMPDPTAPMSPNGNSVSLEEQMVKAVEARHQHDTALAIYKSSLGILRTSLGRR